MLYIVFIISMEYFNFIEAKSFAESYNIKLEKAKNCVLKNYEINLDNCNNELIKCYPNVNIIKQRLKLLKDSNLGLFYSKINKKNSNE